jgi:hypothetical protein
MYKSIDLFAGIGGIRRGFDNAFADSIETVFTSEINEQAKKTYELNYPESKVMGDITRINETDIPPFDICLAGFPWTALCRQDKLYGWRLYHLVQKHLQKCGCFCFRSYFFYLWWKIICHITCIILNL